jgi:hypothetical protein
MATKVAKKKTPKPKGGNFYVFGSDCGDDNQLEVVSNHATEAQAKTAAIAVSKQKAFYGSDMKYNAVKVFQLIGKMEVKPPEYTEV